MLSFILVLTFSFVQGNVHAWLNIAWKFLPYKCIIMMTIIVIIILIIIFKLGPCKQWSKPIAYTTWMYFYSVQ